MQQDDFEVTFCDLCGASVPAADLATGAAARTNGKIVGACCLAGLRTGATPAVGTTVPSRAGGGDSRLMPVAVVLLAAVAVATIFLDHRLATTETAALDRHGQLVQIQRSDSEVLQTVGVDMDGTARRADVDELARGVKTVEDALRLGEERSRQELDQVRQEVAALRQELRTAQAATIDYRPLFDDLRQQLHRQASTLADLRSAPPAPATPREAAADPALPAVPDETPGLPAELAEHVQRLRADDPAIRFEAVDELARSRDPLVLPHLVTMIRDPDSYVRRVTMDGLVGFRAVEAVDALLIGLGDADEYVRDTAWRSLRELTGQKFAFDASNPSKDVRARGQQRWQEWWDKNRATFVNG